MGHGFMVGFCVAASPAAIEFFVAGKFGAASNYFEGVSLYFVTAVAPGGVKTGALHREGRVSGGGAIECRCGGRAPAGEVSVKDY